MTDPQLESLRDWIVTTIANLEEMGRDDPPKRERAANGRFIKAQP